MQPRCWKGVAAGFPPGFALQRDGSGFLRRPHNCDPVEMLLPASSQKPPLPLPILPGPSHPPPGQLQQGQKQQKANLYLKKEKKNIYIYFLASGARMGPDRCWWNLERKGREAGLSLQQHPDTQLSLLYCKTLSLGRSNQKWGEHRHLCQEEALLSQQDAI